MSGFEYDGDEPVYRRRVNNLTDPSDLLVAECQSCRGPPPAGGGYGNVVNVMSEENKKIEQRAARLKASLQPRKDMMKKGPVTRGDSRYLPLVPPDVLRNISKFLVEDDEFTRKEMTERREKLEKDIDYLERHVVSSGGYISSLESYIKRIEDKQDNIMEQRELDDFKKEFRADKGVDVEEFINNKREQIKDITRRKEVSEKKLENRKKELEVVLKEIEEHEKVVPKKPYSYEDLYGRRE